MSKPNKINLQGDACSERSIVLYKLDGKSVPVEVHYMNETFWLTQEEMAALFDVDRTVISKHLKNIVKEGELSLESICAKIAHMGSNGQTYEKGYYNLDAIIAVGYRVGEYRRMKLVEAKKIYSVLKQSSLWKTVHRTVFVAAELRAEHILLASWKLFLLNKQNHTRGCLL